MLSALDLDAVDYTCPECGASAEGPITFSSEVETIDAFPLVPAWQGGPLISDTGQLAEPVKVNQWFSTSVCADRFSTWLWDISLNTRGDGTSTLAIRPKRR